MNALSTGVLTQVWSAVKEQATEALAQAAAAEQGHWACHLVVPVVALVLFIWQWVASKTAHKVNKSSSLPVPITEATQRVVMMVVIVVLPKSSE